MRLVCISNNPLPYHTPILNELGRLVKLHVVYMSRGHPLGSFTDLWGEAPEFSHSYYWSFSLRVGQLDFRAQVSIGTSRMLRRLKPDVILFSSWGPLVIEPLLWSRIARRRAVMWAESTEFSGLLRGRLSNAIRHCIVSHTDAFVANGSLAADFLKSLGADPATIVTSCLPSPMRSGGISESQTGRASEQEQPATRFLFVGRLIPQKRPLELIECFRYVRSKLPGARLTIVGDGPLLPRVTEAAEVVGPALKLLGRLEGDALSEIFAEADILVLPSIREVWGLVVNEALTHGLYVVATDQVGSAHDLVDSTCGSIVPAHDMDAFAAAMVEAAVKKPHDRATRRVRAQRVRNCTPRTFASDIRQAASIALGNGGGQE